MGWNMWNPGAKNVWDQSTNRTVWGTSNDLDGMGNSLHNNAWGIKDSGMVQSDSGHLDHLDALDGVADATDGGGLIGLLFDLFS